MMLPHRRAESPDDARIIELASGALNDVLATICAPDGEPFAHDSTDRETELTVSHGACGVAHALTQMRQECPARLLEWMRSRSVDTSQYAPGLMTGLAGMAWTFWELGCTDDAERLIATAFRHPQMLAAADVCIGSSGIGLAALWMAARTNEKHYVEKARGIGVHLSRTARCTDRGVYWPAADGRVRLGYAHGASGVAAFLLYLYLSTGEWRWLKLGRQALEFDVRHAPVCACWERGTAGMAGVLARYYAVLGHPPYETVLCAIATRSTRRLGPALGYFHGLAGIGQFFLDLAILCRSPRAERWAIHIANTIASCSIRRAGGYTFAEQGHRTVNGDLATGAAGIALFFTRLHTRQTSSFMLDELFDRDHLRPLVSWSP